MLSDGLQANTSLNGLDLSGNNIGDDGIAYLCKSLQLNKTLRTLEVSICGLTKLGIQPLAVMLTFNTTIREISWASGVPMTTVATLKEWLASLGLLTPYVEAVLF